MIIFRKYWIAITFLLLPFTVWSSSEPAIFSATKNLTDPYYPYVKRPLLDSEEATKTYGQGFLQTIKQQSDATITHVPWTIKPKNSSILFALEDVVVDRIIDKETGKRYLKLYHATTSDLLNIFKPGASAIRFDISTNTALGMGFYVATNINEAKYYGCERLGSRKASDSSIKTIVLVIGVEENPVIKGKTVLPDTQRESDDTSGESLDPAVYFVQNKERTNQFVLFKRIWPYLKILEIAILPDQFGKSIDRQDGDGLPSTSTLPQMHMGYKCFY